MTPSSAASATSRTAVAMPPFGDVVHRVHFEHSRGDPGLRHDADPGIGEKTGGAPLEVRSEGSPHVFLPFGRDDGGGFDGDALRDHQHVALPGARGRFDALGGGHADHRSRDHDSLDRRGDLGVAAGGHRPYFVASAANPVGDRGDPAFGGSGRGEHLGKEPTRFAPGGGHVVGVHDHRVPAGVGAREGDRIGGQHQPRLVSHRRHRRVLPGCGSGIESGAVSETPKQLPEHAGRDFSFGESFLSHPVRVVSRRALPPLGKGMRF